MWLPDSIYEALPAIYVVLGLMLVAGASYLGLADPSAALYFALGVAATLTGFFVRQLRRKMRGNDEEASSGDLSKE